MSFNVAKCRKYFNLFLRRELSLIQQKRVKSKFVFRGLGKYCVIITGIIGVFIHILPGVVCLPFLGE